ncbi:MAG: hypothetical protein AB1427_11265 [Thermodesulfobacteriota bacterium]
MNIIIFIIVLVAAVILWLVFSKKRDTEKAVTYECPHCGEHHCDCYRKDEIRQPDKD